MAIEMNRTLIITGVVENSESGIVRFDKPVTDGGSDVFRSMHLNKFPKGTRLELTFRVTASQRSLVRYTPILPEDRFFVRTVSWEDNVDPAEVAKFLAEKGLISWDPQDDAAIDWNSPFVLQEGLAYDDAVDVKTRAQEELGEDMVVNMFKHDESYPLKFVATPGQEAIRALEWVGKHWISPEMRPIFLTALNAIKSGDFLNVHLKGPSGNGKTSICKALAEWLGVKFLRINCAIVLDTESWFGYHEARGGDTVFIPTTFTKLLREGGAVILLDEANRIEPWIANSLFPILDHARETEVHGETIKCGPGIIFCLSTNIGAKYVGTHSLDKAFINRIDMTETLEVPPRDIEEDIVNRAFPEVSNDMVRKIVGLLHDIRGVVDRESYELDVSVRTSFKMAHSLKLGLDIRSAARYVLVNVAEPDEKKAILDIVNTRLGMEKL